MRATYEDLLRAARRAAVQAHQVQHTDNGELLSGWQAVLIATRSHLGWLRCDIDLTGDAVALNNLDRSKGLMPVAWALGAGADLLATQDAYNAAALDNCHDLLAARAEVADVARIAGRTVLRDLGMPKRSKEYRHVLKAVAQLGEIVTRGRGASGLGDLRNLATNRPQYGTDELSQLAWMAVRWERAHLDIDAHTLLTRDLRSGTSQLRTICGYAWHLTDCIASVAEDVGLDAQQRLDLARLREALRAFDTAAARVARSWQQRLSDIGGQSGTPGEVAFLDLKATFDAFLRADGNLLAPKALIPDHRQAIAALDALDEMVDSASRIARFQQAAVDDLIRSGHLFMPVRDIASMELPHYSRRVARPAVARRWMRTSVAMYFTELTSTLTQSAAHLAIAADVARHLSGTSHHSRPFGDRSPRLQPPPLLVSKALVAESTGLPDLGQEPDPPGR
ncbi:hypothetical protein GCM10009554_42860 [Kribbella koreensis]|uniref:DUF2786 domain-containing protein n=1 Tax=Kribbella koreensis TaxID=57909 RepID=A0ABP4B6A8_9ACTN